MKIDTKKYRLKKYLLNKYVIAILIFLIILLFFDRYSLIDRWKNARTISKLEKSIEYYNQEIEKDKKRKQDLQSGDEMLEKYGREEFYFKKKGEDIYIIEEKDYEN